MRISAAAWLLLLVGYGGACGGTQHGKGGIAGCPDYAVAMRAPLGRLARAADGAQLGGTPDQGARGARELAAKLGSERDGLGKLRIDDAELRRVHRPLVDALGEMTAALELLAAVLEKRDETRREEARARLAHANERWGQAVEAVRAVCPLD